MTHALTPTDILRAVDSAIEEQGRWSTRWHRALICGLPADTGLVAEESGHLTGFGIWHDQNKADPLLSQTVFEELWASFLAMHATARRIITEATQSPVQPADYDHYITVADDFLTRARRIRDAFRKAVSDLDPLTGLSNRTTMTAELAAEYERATRTGSSLCFALADIDHFKKVNDTHGHAVGDQVLTATAGRFLSQLRPYDMIYRYGGEEFLLCLPNADPETAQSVLERLRETLCARAIPLETGEELAITASFGFARVLRDIPMKEIIERADQALYLAKTAGRNRVASYDDIPPEEVT